MASLLTGKSEKNPSEFACPFGSRHRSSYLEGSSDEGKTLLIKTSTGLLYSHSHSYYHSVKRLLFLVTVGRAPAIDMNYCNRYPTRSAAKKTLLTAEGLQLKQEGVFYVKFDAQTQNQLVRMITFKKQRNIT